MMPKVTHCADDKNWGKPGYSKQIFVAKSLTQPGGWASTDKVIERIDHTYRKRVLENVRFMAYSHEPYIYP